ncbi:hypothetical protein V8C37DRAFT_145966 [Trichoderma ceciliae]
MKYNIFLLRLLLLNKKKLTTKMGIFTQHKWQIKSGTGCRRTRLRPRKLYYTYIPQPYLFASLPTPHQALSYSPWASLVDWHRGERKEEEEKNLPPHFPRSAGSRPPRSNRPAAPLHRQSRRLQEQLASDSQKPSRDGARPRQQRPSLDGELRVPPGTVSVFQGLEVFSQWLGHERGTRRISVGQGQDFRSVGARVVLRAVVIRNPVSMAAFDATLFAGDEVPSESGSGLGWWQRDAIRARGSV